MGVGVWIGGVARVVVWVGVSIWVYDWGTWACGATTRAPLPQAVKARADEMAIAKERADVFMINPYKNE